MVSLKVNIQKKDLWLLSAIVVFMVGVGFVVATATEWKVSKAMFHNSEDVKVTIDDLNYSLQEALDEGLIGGGGIEEVRIWQNMGPRSNADSQDHSTSCDSGYLMGGLRIYASGALDGRMIAHCTKSSLSLSGSTVKGPVGNIDNGFHNLNCNNNQVIRSITIYASRYFDYNLRLNCGNLVGSSLDNTNPVWAVHRYHGANNDQYPGDLNSLDSRDQIADCPQGYVATGVRFWASTALESFDILCKKII